MSVSTVRLRLKTLQAAIPGITKAYVQLPRGFIQTAELPLFINFVRNAEHDVESEGTNDVVTTRTYLMWLLVKPAAEGEEGEGETLVEPWIETVSAYFHARPSLQNLVGVVEAVLVEDSGPKKLVWPGLQSNPQGVYWGVEFRLDVTETFKRTYAANE